MSPLPNHLSSYPHPPSLLLTAHSFTLTEYSDASLRAVFCMLSSQNRGKAEDDFSSRSLFFSCPSRIISACLHFSLVTREFSSPSSHLFSLSAPSASQDIITFHRLRWPQLSTSFLFYPLKSDYSSGSFAYQEEWWRLRLLPSASQAYGTVPQDGQHARSPNLRSLRESARSRA